MALGAQKVKTVKAMTVRLKLSGHKTRRENRDGPRSLTSNSQLTQPLIQKGARRCLELKNPSKKHLNNNCKKTMKKAVKSSKT